MIKYSKFLSCVSEFICNFYYIHNMENFIRYNPRNCQISLMIFQNIIFILNNALFRRCYKGSIESFSFPHSVSVTDCILHLYRLLGEPQISILMLYYELNSRLYLDLTSFSTSVLIYFHNSVQDTTQNIMCITPMSYEL